MKNQQSRRGNWVIEVPEAKPHEALFKIGDDLFMPRGEVCLLTSNESIGKTLLVAHLGVSLALPDVDQYSRLRSIRGETLKPCPTHEPKVVLIYAYETRNDIKYRLKTLLTEEPGGKVDPEILNRLSGRLIPAPLRDEDWDISIYEPHESGKATEADARFNDLHKMLSGLGHIDLIVFDPLGPFDGWHSTKNGVNASGVINQFNRLTQLEGNPTILLVDNGAGSGPSLKDCVRWVGSLTEIDRDDQGRSMLELVVTKSNYGPSGLSVVCLSDGQRIEPVKHESLDNENIIDGVAILKELRRLILLSIDEHGQEMHDHSAQLLGHIERTLREIKGKDHDND